MSNPVVVEVLRGERVESAHRGAGAVVDADGRMVFAFGDVDRPVYPRSAVKALQALPLIESGAADRLGLGEQEIALACASHSGEEAHVALAAAMLAKAGRDAKRARMRRALAARRRGRPCARPFWPKPRRAAQQLLGEARGLRLRRLRRRHRAEGLCRLGSPRAARGHGGAGGRDAGAAR